MTHLSLCGVFAAAVTLALPPQTKLRPRNASASPPMAPREPLTAYLSPSAPTGASVRSAPFPLTS